MIKPIKQKQLAKWILLLGTTFSFILSLMGRIEFAKGLLFGAILCVANYYIIDALLGYIISFSNDIVVKVVGFFGYHIRFWILVVILFFVITRNDSPFAFGFFAAMVLSKIVMGAVVISNTGEEWWNKRVNENPDP